MTPLRMAREDIADGCDEVVFGDGKLRGAGFLPLLVVLDGGCSLGAFDQVLELHFAFGAFVGALDDHAGRAALI